MRTISACKKLQVLKTLDEDRWALQVRPRRLYVAPRRDIEGPGGLERGLQAVDCCLLWGVFGRIRTNLCAIVAKLGRFSGVLVHFLHIFGQVGAYQCQFCSVFIEFGHFSALLAKF